MAGDTNSVWYKIKHMFRRIIYPRTFIVTLKDEQTGETSLLQFRATDKTEDQGRFFGDCVETIVVVHDDYQREFGKGRSWKRFLNTIF